MNPDAYEFHRRPNTPANQFRGHHILSDQVGPQELGVIWNALQKVLAQGIPGAIVEFGCYVGTTSLFIRRLLDQAGQSALREFHVYDSFEGLPPKTAPDTSPSGVDFAAGKLRVSKKEFLRQFHRVHLTPPTIHKGWFNQLTENDIPPSIAFAYLDGDFYESILSPLHFVWPRLAPEGVIIVDDYNREALPGPARAIAHYFSDKHTPHLRQSHDMAIITKDPPRS